MPTLGIEDLMALSSTDRSRTVCFTGPRPKKLCGYDHGSYRGAVAELTGLVEALYREGYRHFLTGGAQGFDQLAFWAVHKARRQMGCPDLCNSVAVPFVGQEARWAEKGCFGQDEYRTMLAVADRVFVVGEATGRWGAAMHRRNRAMVDASALCVALYGGGSAFRDAATGGTEATMRYAEATGIPLRVLGYRIVPGVPATLAIDAPEGDETSR